MPRDSGGAEWLALAVIVLLYFLAQRGQLAAGGFGAAMPTGTTFVLATPWGAPVSSGPGGTGGTIAGLGGGCCC